MKYKNSYKLKLTFQDGKLDSKVHPYIVLLDRNNMNSTENLLLQSKTYHQQNAFKLNRYINSGQSYGPIMLKNRSVINLSEIYECSSIQSARVFQKVSKLDFNNLAIALINAYKKGLLTPKSITTLTRHAGDLSNRMNEHGLNNF